MPLSASRSERSERSERAATDALRAPGLGRPEEASEGDEEIALSRHVFGVRLVRREMNSSLLGRSTQEIAVSLSDVLKARLMDARSLLGQEGAELGISIVGVLRHGEGILLTLDAKRSARPEAIRACLSRVRIDVDLVMVVRTPAASIYAM